MKLNFPIGGLHEGMAATEQPYLTSPSLRNVRPFNAIDGRFSGGQRPGFIKAYSTQIAGDHPIIKITQIATTYTEPEA